MSAVPQLDIVQISKEVLVTYDDQVDDDAFDEGDVAIKAGAYAIDSTGRVWMEVKDVSALFQAFDIDEPVRKRDRAEARKRKKKAKRRRIR